MQNSQHIMADSPSPLGSSPFTLISGGNVIGCVGGVGGNLVGGRWLDGGRWLCYEGRGGIVT